MRGRFITFEGPEGAGKSTHAEALAARLQAAGRAVCRIREPGGTRTGEAIRAILQHDHADEALHPEAELLLFEASRAQLVRQVILPALEQGRWVISDRFADSTTVYQGVARGLGVERVESVNAVAVGAAWPDLTILLDVDVERGFRRIAERNRRLRQGLDRIEREGLEFHRRVRDGYLALARTHPGRFRIVDAGRDFDEVAGEVWSLVQHAFS